MIEAVDFVSKATFDGIVPCPSWAAISIGNPAETPPRKLASYARALRLEFLDCEEEDLLAWGMPPEVLCQPEQVTELVRFIQAVHADPLPCQVLVHCHLGCSRSAAAALVVAHLTQCAFPREPDAHFANQRLLTLASAQLGVPLSRPPLLPDHSYLPSSKALLSL